MPVTIDYASPQVRPVGGGWLFALLSFLLVVLVLGGTPVLLGSFVFISIGLLDGSPSTVVFGSALTLAGLGALLLATLIDRHTSGRGTPEGNPLATRKEPGGFTRQPRLTKETLE